MVRKDTNTELPRYYVTTDEFTKNEALEKHTFIEAFDLIVAGIKTRCTRFIRRNFGLRNVDNGTGILSLSRRRSNSGVNHLQYKHEFIQLPTP